MNVLYTRIDSFWIRLKLLTVPKVDSKTLNVDCQMEQAEKVSIMSTERQGDLSSAVHVYEITSLS